MPSDTPVTRVPLGARVCRGAGGAGDAVELDGGPSVAREPVGFIEAESGLGGL